jgi:hypothetical protein
VITETKVEALMGVALVHEDVFKKNKAAKVFIQIILLFR